MYFCYYSCAAICFIFIYCVTIFTAFLSLQARWEEEAKNAVTGQKVIAFNKIGMIGSCSLDSFFAEKEPLYKVFLNTGSQGLAEKEESNNNEKSDQLVKLQVLLGNHLFRIVECGINGFLKTSMDHSL